MTPLHALRHATSALAGAARGAGRELAPALDLPPLPGVPEATTTLAGADVEALEQRPWTREWLTGMADWLTGGVPIPQEPPVVEGRWAIWPLLHDGGGQLDPAVFAGVIPDGAAWLAARDAPRFFAQAADRLEAGGSDRAVQWAARLRQPEGNLALVGRIVTAAALSMDGDDSGSVLRLRVCCPDVSSARQTQFLLHGWRMRKAMSESAAARVFASSDIVRHGQRVEMTLPGETSTIVGLFARG